jgi:hypothetical protein
MPVTMRNRFQDDSNTCAAAVGVSGESFVHEAARDKREMDLEDWAMDGNAATEITVRHPMENRSKYLF